MTDINSCGDFCRGCEICDEIEEEFCDICNYNKDICICIRSSFFKENELNNQLWNRICVTIPYSNNGEFYFKFEFIGNKHFVDSKNKQDVIAWMKLTEKLFL